MVQAKFGMPAVAGRQMEVFSTAVLLATHSPPAVPPQARVARPHGAHVRHLLRGLPRCAFLLSLHPFLGLVHVRKA